MYFFCVRLRLNSLQFVRRIIPDMLGFRHQYDIEVSTSNETLILEKLFAQMIKNDGTLISLPYRVGRCSLCVFIGLWGYPCRRKLRTARTYGSDQIIKIRHPFFPAEPVKTWDLSLYVTRGWAESQA